MSGYEKVIQMLSQHAYFSAEDYNNIARYAINMSRETGKRQVRSFGVGSEVVFQNPRNGSTYQGVLVKINRAKAQVKVGGTVWNVPFSLLKTA